MNINDCRAYLPECADALTFSSFFAFLGWVASNWSNPTFGGEEEYIYWAGFYSNMLTALHTADLGAVLTLLADSFLENDKACGVITDDEKDWRSNVWQELARCDCLDVHRNRRVFQNSVQDIVTVTKTFNV